MALNLGAQLRDAVDGPGPGLDGVVGEDPADVDLPALSARIRHRRRVRATTRSAVGVAAAGAVALVGAQGLGGRGAETLTNPLTSPITSPGSGLCGHDVAAVPVAGGDSRLVPSGVAAGAAADPMNLGTFVGRTLTAALVQDGAAGTASAGQVALTTGSTVVAVGTVQRNGDPITAAHGSATVPAGSTVSSIAADLTPCPAASGTPATVPAGVYSVQYLVPLVTVDANTGAASSTGVRRAAGGPWRVTLLDEPPAVTLPTAYPAREVPVVGGTLLSAVPDPATPTGWTVRVAVDGVDGLTRAAAALRGAGADVVVPGLDVAAGSNLVGAPAAEGSGIPSDVLALQTQLAAASVEVATAQKAYDQLLATYADPDTMAWAARQLEAASARMADLGTQLQVATSAGTDALRAQLAAASAAASAAAATAEQSRAGGPTSVEAVTSAWVVTVTEASGGGGPVLTYALIGH